MEIYLVKACNKFCELDIDKAIQKLDKDRQKKILEIKHEGEKLRSIFAGLLFRYAFLKSGFSNNDWDCLTLEYNEYGKPRVKGNDKFNYSISHSGDWVICVYDDENVGVDIQEKRPWKLQMAKRFYSDKEYERLINIDEKLAQGQTDVFYKIWSAKESCVKLIGRGIGGGISQYVTDDEFRYIEEFDTDGICINRYNMKIYDEIEGYIISVCSKKSSFPHKINIVEKELLVSDGGRLC